MEQPTEYSTATFPGECTQNTSQNGSERFSMARPGDSVELDFQRIGLKL